MANPIFSWDDIKEPGKLRNLFKQDNSVRPDTTEVDRLPLAPEHNAFPLEPDTPFTPPTSIDRKFDGKGSQYRNGISTGPVQQRVPGLNAPIGRELPSMILRDEPGFEEEPIV